MTEFGLKARVYCGVKPVAAKRRTGVEVSAKHARCVPVRCTSEPVDA